MGCTWCERGGGDCNDSEPAPLRRIEGGYGGNDEDVPGSGENLSGSGVRMVVELETECVSLLHQVVAAKRGAAVTMFVAHTWGLTDLEAAWAR